MNQIPIIQNNNNKRGGDEEDEFSRYPSPDIDKSQSSSNLDINFPRSPERSIPIITSQPPTPKIVAPYNPQYNSMNLRPPNHDTNSLSPIMSPQRTTYQQLSPQRSPHSPQNNRSSIYNEQLEQLSSYSLSSVVNHSQLKQALENILTEIISERKDSDNSLKRLWIFQHLIETPCSKCCFIGNDDGQEDAQIKNRFRIKSKCLSSHFRVSGNTPFNWLSRDFIRVHAPHSSGVPERKDLREIYYDGFGLFREDMKVQDFIQLSKQLAGRPTTSSKKRKNRPSDGSINNNNNNNSSQSIGDSSNKLQKKMDHDSPKDDDATLTFRSRLVFSLKVANRSQIIMYHDRMDFFLTKIESPKELPTFRPEISTKYEIGRREKKEEDEEQNNPFKIYIEDISISRNHLVILFSENGWSVMDVGSSLGTIHIRQKREEDYLGSVSTKLERNVPFSLEEGDTLMLSEGIAMINVLSCKFYANDVYLINNMHS